MPIATIGIINWRYLLWPVGSIFLLFIAMYASIWYWQNKREHQQPLLFLVEKILWHFRNPLLQVALPSLLLITMGFVAGSHVSMILFVLLSTITVMGVGAMIWWIWPKDTAEGNLFDLVPLPKLKWPAFENSQDRLMRVWVEHRAKEVKQNPPDFSGAVFGTIAFEIAKESAEIYQKKTPLSVSIDDLLKGVERTAADLKILTNHLPLAGQFTLAELERQIEFAAQKGRLLYAGMFLILSFFNPGNLVRVLLAFVQQKSPWEHLIKELRGWLYGHYTEHLGYHMALIHSQRQPPSPESIQKAIDDERKQRGEAIRMKKLGSLAFLGLFGFSIYLVLQLINATLVFGLPAFFFGLVLIILCAYGVWGLREPKRWEDLWRDILPKWPEIPPPETEKDLLARQKMVIVLKSYEEPPSPKDLEEMKKLPAYYGNIFLDFWEACYSSYRPIDETDETRATRECYLPQAFAGIEDVCASLHHWFSSSALVPRAIRQAERFGVNLETIYLYTKKKSDAIEHPLPPIEDEQVAQKQLPVPQEQEKQEEQTQEQEKSTVIKWLGRVGRSIGNYAKSVAIKQLHQAILEQFSEELGEQLILIYGARYPRSVFDPHPPEVASKKILVLSREWEAHQTFLPSLLAGVPLHSEEPTVLDGTTSGTITKVKLQNEASFTFDIYPLPRDPNDEETIEMLLSAIHYRRYHRILLVDTIDYGARERVRHLMQETLVPALRKSEVGSMALVLTGAEKLKPLRWDPPYDDYLQDEPEKRKSQRIRNAVLAWAKAFDDFYAMHAIYPIGRFQESEEIEYWGLHSLQKFVGLSNEEPNEQKEQKINSFGKELEQKIERGEEATEKTKQSEKEEDQK